MSNSDGWSSSSLLLGADDDNDNEDFVLWNILVRVLWLVLVVDVTVNASEMARLEKMIRDVLIDAFFIVYNCIALNNKI